VKRAGRSRTDPDVDDVGYGLACPPPPLARADGVGKGLHLLQHPIHVGHDVLPVDHDRAVGAVAKRHMEDGPCKKVRREVKKGLSERTFPR